MNVVLRNTLSNVYCNAEGGAKLQSYDRVYSQSHGVA